MRTNKLLGFLKALACSVIIIASFFNETWAQLSGYSYGKEITVDATKVSGSSALTDFPMLINVTDLNLRTTANGGHVENSNGYDIEFTSSSCGGILDHEIESYDPTTGEYIAWVRIPSLDHSVNTVVQMYYGNSAVSSDPSTTAVWTSNYENVYHMNQDPSGSAPQMTESTPHGRDATSSGSMTNGDVVSAQIGDGIALDGTDDQFTSTSTSTLDQTVTWTVWLNVNGIPNDFDGLFYDGGGINLMSDNTVRLAWGGAWIIPTTATFTLSQWVYIAVAVNGTPPVVGTNDVIYVGNGGTISSYQYVNRDFTSLNFSSFRIGNQNCCSNTRFLNASIDEARFISSTLSADWIATEYNNQYSPSTFYSFSSEMNAGDLCVTLPIELLDFGVTNNSNEYVEIQWSTLTETNNDYFTIERSTNGSNFETIGQLEGAGNSKSIQSYFFLDNSPLNGVNYYRVKQTDFDGSYDFTNTESVNFNQDFQVVLVPNPATDDVSIIGQLSKGSNITIYNLSGVAIKKLLVNEKLKEMSFSIENLDQGIYILAVENGNRIRRLKFFKK